MQKQSGGAELYFFRHGETAMNTNPHLVGGRSDTTQLTVKGIRQAELLGEGLLALGIFPDEVYSSPAIRAVDSACHSLQKMNVHTDIIINSSLQELSQGIAEGKERAEIFTKEVMEEIERLDKDFKLQGGESMNDVGERMFHWTKKTIVESSTEKPKIYFIYTHGGSIKYLASYLLGWSGRQTYETPIDNASVSLFTVQDNICRVNYLNRNVNEIRR